MNNHTRVQSSKFPMPPYWPLDGNYAPCYHLGTNSILVTAGSDHQSFIPIECIDSGFETTSILEDIHLPIHLLPILVEEFDDSINHSMKPISSSKSTTWQDSTALDNLKRLASL